MIASFSKALGQLPEKGLRNVVLLGVFASLLLFVGLAVGAWLLIGAFAVFGIGWLDETLAAAGGIAVLVLSWLLFPAAANAVSGLFLERVAKAVEDKHYPELPPGREQPVVEAIVGALRFLGVAIVLNILVLPLYLFAPLAPFVFYILNGYLLGREYFEMVALRRMEPADATAMRKRFGFRIWMAGALMAFISTIPILNLTAPVLGAAFMLHIFEGLRSTSPE